MGGKLQQSLHDVNLIHHLLHRNDYRIGACAEHRRSLMGHKAVLRSRTPDHGRTKEQQLDHGVESLKRARNRARCVGSARMLWWS